MRDRENRGLWAHVAVSQTPQTGVTHGADTPDSHQCSGWALGKTASIRRRLTSHHFTFLPSVSLRRVTQIGGRS
jgi:hypothetical protein